MNSPDTPLSPASSHPLGSLEYELTDELATQGALVLFEVQTQRVKASIVRQGMPHPIMPLAITMTMLVIGMVAMFVVGGNSLLTWLLIPLALAALLLLAFKTGLYFVPPFARWYTGRTVRRELRKLSHRTIRWTFFDDRFETHSAAINRKVPWTDLREVQLLPGFWFLNLESGPQLSIPLMALSADVQAIILRKGTEAGAQIDERIRTNRLSV